MVTRESLNLLTTSENQLLREDEAEFGKLSDIEKNILRHQRAIKRFCIAISHIDFMPAQGYA